MKKILIALLVLLCVSNSINCMEAKDKYKDLSKEELNKRLTYLLNSEQSRNDLEEFVGLIIMGADVDIQGNYGETALHNAAYAGDVKVVRLLIDKGANIDHKDNCGRIALHHAAYAGNVEVIRLLLDKGADRDIQNNNGLTALNYAKDSGHKKIVELLRKKDHDWSACCIVQ